MVGRAWRVFHTWVKLATCPWPLSVIAVCFVVDKYIFHCHVARRIGIWWQSAIIYNSTHNWWKGSIYSIVTVLRDLAPDDNNYTPLVEGKHIFHCHSARRLAPGDSHPSYTTVYVIDGGHRLYRVVWHNQAAWTYMCAKQTVAYTKSGRAYGCARV